MNISRAPSEIFSCPTQKMKFSIKDFFSKCEQIRRKLRIRSHLLKKPLMENFIFWAVLWTWIWKFVRSKALMSLSRCCWPHIKNLESSWYLFRQRPLQVSEWVKICWRKWKLTYQYLFVEEIVKAHLISGYSHELVSNFYRGLHIVGIYKVRSQWL